MDSTREAFERWAIKREFDVMPNTTVWADELPYADIETQSHFDAWKASRSAAIEECATVVDDCHCMVARIGCQPKHIAELLRALKGEG